jgi:hypothetical protein
MRPSGHRPRRSSGRTTGRRPAGHLRHRRHRRRRPAYRVGLPSVRASTARWRPSGTAPCPASPSRMCSWTPPTARPGSTAAWSPRQWWWPPGVCGDGRREVLGFAVGDSEDGAFWTQFLRSLKARGLAGVQVIADASTCAKPSAPSWPARRYSAAGSTPPQRPAPSAQGVGRDGRDRHPHDFAQPDAAHVHEQLDVIAGMLGRQFRKLEAMLRDAAGVHRLPGQPLEEGLVDQSAGAAQHGSHLHHAAGRHPLRCSGTASAGRALGFRSRPSRQRHRLPAGRPSPTGSLSSNRKGRHWRHA